MFDFLKKKKAQTILFDESYCHSAGVDVAQSYQLEKGVTDLTFDFGSLEDFTRMYIRENPYFPEDAIEALQQDKAIVTMQVVQDSGTYMVSQAGLSKKMLLNSDTMAAMGAKKFKHFSDGVIAIGIYHLGEFRFQVLWATMYEAS